jgi:hypothetical protein
MPYIPKIHMQYPVLPHSREHGGEVFQYDPKLNRKLEELVGEQLIPYGYDSYESYLARIDELIQSHDGETDTMQMLKQLKQSIIELNQKENWSICKYLGESFDDGFGLSHGGYYYWPCTADDPYFSGIIDDEEFTAYDYPTDPDLWDIIFDPTGMARQTIFGGLDADKKETF